MNKPIRFRRRPATASGPIAVDPLLTADLPERVATGRNRLAYQSDPALREALSERELLAERALAERMREHQRSEQLAELKTAEETAAEIRKTTAEIMRTEARDLATSRRALADQRREASPHAQLAQLYRIKKWSGRALAGVVAGAMMYSAANVQHNLAPGGPSEPLFWMSYLLEALISTVLVVFMVSGSAVARWKITEGEKAIQWTEAALLAGSILLNTYPYMRADGWDWKNIGVHSVAPIMMGVALFGHQAVAKRMGAAIAQASLEVTAADDTAERLAALLDRARTITPSAATPSTGSLPGDVGSADSEQQLADSTAHTGNTVQPSVDRAHSYPTARADTVHRAVESASTVQHTVHRAERDATDTVQLPVSTEMHTEQFPRTVQSDTVHRAAAVDQVHGVDTVQHATSMSTLPNRKNLDTARGTHAAAEAMPNPARSETEQATPCTVQNETEQFPRTVQETVHPDTVHRAAATETVQPTVHTVQHTEQADTVHRAPASATGQRTAEEDSEVLILAAEVHGRLPRTRFSVEDVAKVLTAHRRDGFGADRIYRDKIGPHRDTTAKWIKLAAEIEGERAADMAPVIALREHG